MYLKDFIFNGIKLSDVGFFVGSAVTENSESINAGSKLVLNTIRNNSLYTSEIINVDYDSTIETTFDIIKNPCKPSFQLNMSDDELSFIFQWLNAKKYCKFVPIYNDDEFYNTYYMGTFTEIKPISKTTGIIGLTVTFTTNAPYGFKEIDKRNFHISDNESFAKIHNDSDENGIIYPDIFQFSCLEDGALNIYNLVENPNHINTERHTHVANCTSGEVITFDCIHKIITSSNNEHTTICNDFNYMFPRLYNGDNKFMSSIACDIYVDYKPIRKVGVIA